MEQKQLLLPIGIQTFSTMIEDHFLYIDKTEYIYQLIQKGRYYFLSRPRRFGKSLLISTLEEIFSGNQKLFSNLFIGKTDFEWIEHPVIVLSLSSLSVETGEALKNDLTWTLLNIANKYNLNISDAPSLQTKFRSLIEQLAEKNKVVVLVDEYDHPLLKNINNTDLADECREILRDFFSVLKDTDKYLRFIFVTGITKFSKTSIFSGLNNLNDITLDQDAAQLLGYTSEEIATYFKSYIVQSAEKTALSSDELFKNMQFWYNGYLFNKSPINQSKKSNAVYNPFSVILYFTQNEFLNFWFDTGTPFFLMELIKKQRFPITQIEGSEVNAEETKNADIHKIKLIPLLWQTGYLTIESYNPVTKNFRLTYPNNEVKVSFLQHFLSYLTDIDIALFANQTVQLIQALYRNDLDSFFKSLHILFAQIPYTLQLPMEKYYQSIFFVLMKLIGARADAEVVTNDGRIDAVIETSDYIYIFEFKLDQPAENAIKQILDKKYYRRYLDQKKKIYLVGISFETNERTIKEWLVQEVS